MPQVKKTESQEVDDRFAAWKNQVASEIHDSVGIADSAIYALRSPKDFESAIKLARIAVTYYDKAKSLESTLANAEFVRQLQDVRK